MIYDEAQRCVTHVSTRFHIFIRKNRMRIINRSLRTEIVGYQRGAVPPAVQLRRGPPMPYPT